MTISTTTLVDTSNKTITKASGVGSEIGEKIVDTFSLSGATSEPKISVAHVYYEIDGGEVTLYFENDNTKEVILSGRGNYGLKPNEERIKDVVGNILLDSDSDVKSYNIILETQKESGFN